MPRMTFDGGSLGDATLTYTRPWATREKETGAAIPANALACEFATGLVLPLVSDAAGAAPAVLSTWSSAYRLDLIHVGTWAGGIDGAALYFAHTAGGASYVGVFAETEIPLTAGTWAEANFGTVFATDANVRRTRVDYQAGDPLVNARSGQVNLLRNAGALQGESATVRHVPAAFRLVQGVLFCQCTRFVGTGAGTQAGTSLLVHAENLAASGPLQEQVRAAMGNPTNRWVLLSEAPLPALAVAPNARDHLLSVGQWGDDAWVAGIDYRGATGTYPGQGGNVHLTRLRRAAADGSKWQVGRTVYVYSQPPDPKFPHIQGVAVGRHLDRGVCVFISRQQGTTNDTTAAPVTLTSNWLAVTIDDADQYDLDLTRPEDANDYETAATWAWYPITQNNTTVGLRLDVPVGQELALCQALQARPVNVRGVNGGAAAPTPTLGGATNWFRHGHPVNGTHLVATATVVSPGLIDVAMATPLTLSGGANDVTANVANGRNGYLSLNLGTGPIRKGQWSVNEIVHGVPADLVNVHALNQPHGHWGWFSGCQLTPDGRSLIMGTDGSAGGVSRIDLPLDVNSGPPLVTLTEMIVASSRPAVHRVLVWLITSTNGGYSARLEYEIAAAPKAAQGLMISRDGVTWAMAWCGNALPYGGVMRSRVLIGEQRVVGSVAARRLVVARTPEYVVRRGLLTNNGSRNWVTSTVVGTAAADVGQTRSDNVALPTVAGRVIAPPPTAGPICRITMPADPTLNPPATGFSYGGQVRIASGINATVPTQLVRACAWVYNLPTQASGFNFRRQPYPSQTERVDLQLRTAQGNQGTIPAAFAIAESGWFPVMFDLLLSGTDENFPDVNVGAYAAGTLNNVEVQIRPAGINSGVFVDALVAFDWVGVSATTLDYPVIPPTVGSAETHTSLSAVVAWTWTNPAEWISIASGVIPRDGSDQWTPHHRRPAGRRLACWRVAGAVRIWAEVDHDDRAVRFVYSADGTTRTNVQTLRPTPSGVALAAATYTAATRTITGAPDAGTTGSLAGCTLFSDRANNPPTSHPCALILTHSGTTMTLDRPMGADGAIGGTVNVMAQEPIWQRSAPVHLGICRRADGSYSLYAMVNGCELTLDVAAATWPDLRPDSIALQSNTDWAVEPLAWCGVDTYAATAPNIAALRAALASGRHVRV